MILSSWSLIWATTVGEKSTLRKHIMRPNFPPSAYVQTLVSMVSSCYQKAFLACALSSGCTVSLALTVFKTQLSILVLL